MDLQAHKAAIIEKDHRRKQPSGKKKRKLLKRNKLNLVNNFGTVEQKDYY